MCRRCAAAPQAQACKLPAQRLCMQSGCITTQPAAAPSFPRCQPGASCRRCRLAGGPDFRPCGRIAALRPRSLVATSPSLNHFLPGVSRGAESGHRGLAAPGTLASAGTRHFCFEGEIITQVQAIGSLGMCSRLPRGNRCRRRRPTRHGWDRAKRACSYPSAVGRWFAGMQAPF